MMTVNPSKTPNPKTPNPCRKCSGLKPLITFFLVGVFSRERNKRFASSGSRAPPKESQKNVKKKSRNKKTKQEQGDEKKKK